MFKISILFSFILNFVTYCKARHISSSTSLQINIREIFKNEGIIPQVVDDVPNEICEVVYQNRTIIPGQFLQGPMTTHPPNVTWKADNNSYYLLFLSGSTRWLPFHPTVFPREEERYPKDFEWENWVVINIPGCNVSAGDTLADYIYPGYPIRDNMREKFAFFVYKQSYKYNYHKLRDYLDTAFPKPPKEITLRNFVNMYKLAEPVAVNCFYTEWDESFRQTMSSMRWECLVEYNGSTRRTVPQYNLSDYVTFDYQKIIRKFGWENYTLAPDQ